MNRFRMCLANPPSAKARALLAILLICTLAIDRAHAGDGDRDTSFGSGGVTYLEWAGGPADDAHLGIGSDGKVYVGATINRDSGNNDFAIARLKTDGSLDLGFGAFGYRSVSFNYVTDGSDRLRGVFPQSDGKLMLLGNAEIADVISAAAPPAMVRLTAAGNVDATFGIAGKYSIGRDQSPWPSANLYLRGVARQTDGKFLFGGYCVSCNENFSAVVLRVNADGTPDSSFGQNGWAKVQTPRSNALWSIGVDRKGRIVLAGNAIDNLIYIPMIVRMTSAGVADATFGGGGNGVALVNLPDAAESNWIATAVAFDRDDALLLSVASNVTLPVQRTGVIRLTADGIFDTAYASNGLRDLTRDDGSKIYSLVVRSDRRLLAAGWIDYMGDLDFYVARTDSSGNLDNSFDANGVARYSLSSQRDVAESVVLSAGKPVIAGRTTPAGGIDVGISVMRLQSDLIFTDGID